jgi:adenosine deaminase
VTFDEFLRRLPKVELHCHLEGSVRASTLVELARKNGVVLPAEDPAQLYTYTDIHQFLRILALICRCLVDREDFARAAYETLEDGVKLGGLRYREMFFSPTDHFANGASYVTVVDGLLEGVHAAERDFGVRCRLLPAINREESPSVALDMVSTVLEHRREEVIGVAMDHAENLGPPERFKQAYDAAAAGGLHRTAHAGEAAYAPPENIVTCLDVLGCERIDHGYMVLQDRSVLDRARDDGTTFTCCLTSSAAVGGFPELSSHPIREMVSEGLRVTLNSDDPPMFDTDIGREFVTVCGEMGYGSKQAREFCLNGVEAAWLDDEDKRNMRRDFLSDIEGLERQLEPVA